MIKNIESVAIIPARSGSKRIKNKNIKIFFKKPMIAWTISALKKFKIFNFIITTSDSKKILKISSNSGSDINILRSKKLSDDKTGIDEVIKDTLIQLKSKFYIKPKYVCCVYPCNPFLKKKVFSLAYKTVVKKNGIILTVCRFSHPIYRAFVIKKKKLSYINSKYKTFRTQDLKETFFDAGIFCWAKNKFWFKKKKNIYPIIVPSWSFVDIDTKEDWKKAKIIYKLNKLSR